MPKTDVHCTRCGRELEPWEDVVIVMAGTVAPVIGDAWWSAQGSDNPYLEVLCSTCRDRDNYIVVELSRGLFANSTIKNILSPYPDEACVIVMDYVGAVGYGVGGSRPIGKLNAVEGDYPVVDDAKGWPEPPETW